MPALHDDAAIPDRDYDQLLKDFRKQLDAARAVLRDYQRAMREAGRDDALRSRDRMTG
jgi:hypothetical protein